jgi:hypothetical protein
VRMNKRIPLVARIANLQRILRIFRQRVNLNRARILNPTRPKANTSRRRRKCMTLSTQSIHSVTHNPLIFQVRMMKSYQQWAEQVTLRRTVSGSDNNSIQCWTFVRRNYMENSFSISWDDHVRCEYESHARAASRRNDPHEWCWWCYLRIIGKARPSHHRCRTFERHWKSSERPRRSTDRYTNLPWC